MLEREIPRKIESSSSNNINIVLTHNNEFLLEINARTIWIYSTIKKSFMRKIKTKYNITSYSLSCNDKILAIGNSKGRI